MLPPGRVQSRVPRAAPGAGAAAAAGDQRPAAGEQTAGPRAAAC